MIRRFALAAILLALLVPAPGSGQQTRSIVVSRQCGDRAVRCVTVTFRNADIRDVAGSFADFSGYSIVVGSGISGMVTAEIRDQPWDLALQAILRAHGLTARETYPGILRIDAEERLAIAEVREPLVTRVFRINYVPVEEVAATIRPLVSERGSVATSPATNTLIVTDTEANLDRIAPLLGPSRMR